MDVLPIVLVAVGGIALLAALGAWLVMTQCKPTVLKDDAQNPSLPDSARLAGNADSAPDEGSANRVFPTENSNATVREDNADVALPETNDIEWQDSDDVYAPTPVVAVQFVRTLGLNRPPDILPQQAYIFVKRAILDKIQAHLRANVEVEQGGLVLGQAFTDSALGTYLLIVHDALPAPDGIETPTFFGYTTASWRTLTPQLQQMPADWTLIGSYHSHPNMGVFLSETDLDTQEDIFCADWQLALVIDPVKDEIGFFVGKDGQPCDNWYFLDT